MAIEIFNEFRQYNADARNQVFKNANSIVFYNQGDGANPPTGKSVTINDGLVIPPGGSLAISNEPGMVDVTPYKFTFSGSGTANLQLVIRIIKSVVDAKFTTK
jgi:hypothetical protein